MPYAELEIIVQRAPDGTHAVDMRFRAEPGDLDRELALNVPLRLDKARLLASSVDAQSYGAELSGALIADQRVREAWITARASAEARDLPLRIRLRLDPGDPELHGIRWETVFDDQGVALARSERFLLSRYLDSADMTRFRTPARPEVTALIVVASPANLPQFNLAPFDASAEAARVSQALADIPAATLITGSSAGPVTLPAVIDALRFGYSVLYLVCHGTIVRGIPYLALENEAGEVEWVPGEELAERIRDLGSERRPALVVLASCQSVGVGQDGATPAALGAQLARAGVAAVIGMQGNVPQAMVARMMPRFFEQLAEDGQIDRALAVARTGLRPDDPWWMPVLFLRARDGRLWRDAPAPQPAPAPPRPSAGAAPAGRPARGVWLAGALGLVALAALALFTLLSRGDPQAQALPTAVILSAAEPTAAPATPPPSPTAAPSPTPAPTVAPVADGKYMVLVADLERQGQEARDLSRDIFEDLQLNIESLPFSNFEIRRLRQVVASDEEAQAAAAAARAAVVVWGRYDDSRIDLNVQPGDLGLFPSIPRTISEGATRRTAELPLRMSAGEGRLASPALAVLTVFNVLLTSAGDNFEVLRLATIQERLQGRITPAEVVGQSSSVRAYQFVTNYYTDTPRAVEALTQGLTDDPNNPVLYVYRATANQRLQAFQAATEDARSALGLVPDWAAANAILSAIAAAQGDFPGALAAFSRVVEARPDDWFSLSYRAGISYVLGDIAAARADLERAIALNPQTSLPYSYAIIIALREGRVADAQELTSEVRQRFSGQRGYDNVFTTATLGGENFVSLAVATFDQLMGAQFSAAVATADRALALAGAGALPPAALADLSFMRGFAQCNAGDYAAAADSYSTALAQSPDFALLHILRAEARSRLGDGLGAIEDLNSAASGPQAERLAPTLQAAQSGAIGCQNVLQ